MYGGGGYGDNDLMPLMSGHHQSYNPFWNPQHNYGGQLYRPNCGELRKHDIGRVVELAGKVHKITKDRFIQLKDYHGITQLVLAPNRADLHRRFSKMPVQSYVAVVGEVRGRPGRGHNEKLQTGDIEVDVHEILMVKINKLERKPPLPTLQYGSEPPSETNPPKITSDEYKKLHSKGLLQLLNDRKYSCGDLPYMVNKVVTLLCWIERATKKFLFIMDGYGKIQAVVPSGNREMESVSASLKQNDVIYVTGTVTTRPEAQRNTASTNGHIELHLEKLEIPVKMELQEKDAEEMVVVPVEASTLNRFSSRTHTCGELRPNHVGQSVTLCGWMHYQRLSKFLVLRDSYGFTQCVLSDQVKDVNISSIPLESVIKVKGVVVMRPPSMENEDMTTGDVEVLTKHIEVLNTANNLQVALADKTLICEQMRLTYRYVDLRSEKMQSNLRLRSQILQNIRNFLINKSGFVEMETPLLTRKLFDDTKNFLVETEEPELYYALVQSAQLFNQMLMAGAMDRCFQISKCFRNEMVTADTQSEFTQLSIEVSFADQNSIIELVEEILHSVYPVSLPEGAFDRLSYRDAIRTYGSATPDSTFDLKFSDISTLFAEHATDKDFGAFILMYPKEAGELTKTVTGTIMKVAKEHKNVVITQDLSRFNEEKLNTLKELIQDYPFFIAAGAWDEACLALGAIRLGLRDELKEKKLLKENVLRPVWIIDHPIFTKDGNVIKFNHQPFPNVHAEDTLIMSDPLKVRAMSFDLVMKGQKMGAGAVRAHDPNLVVKQLRVLGLSDKSIPHFIKTLNSGCPPHAGISIGVDRLVAFACKAGSIRDVIPFPKIRGGKDLVTGAPFHLSRRTITDDDIAEPVAKIMKTE